MAASMINKVVLITGASSGIGRGTAIHFASLGYKLALTGRNVTNLQETAGLCVGAADILQIPADLTIESDVERLVEKTIEHYKQLDVLVNNAGIIAAGGIEDTSLAQYDRVMRLNIRSIYQTTMLAAPHLISTKGSIVNVSSVLGRRAFSGVLACCLAKSALDQFTECVALELASKQVRVNSVNPGVIVTNINKAAGMSDEQYAEMLEKCKNTHAMGRVGDVSEVAKAIAFLASDDSSFITGASSGIGRGTAIHFASLGCRLALTGRNVTGLQETAGLCVGAADILQIPADLTIESDVERLVEKTIQHYKQLDVLVNNAGMIGKGSIETTTLEQYDSMMNVNVRSIYHLTMLAVPHLIVTKGNIVNVSSITGRRAFPGVLAYCMSKSALDQFTECVALELASKQVRVNSVNPGVIATELHKRGGQTDEEYAAFLEKCKSTHALGRVGDVSEVAKAIAFLASDDSSFITGTHVPVDGGRHAMCPR